MKKSIYIVLIIVLSFVFIYFGYREKKLDFNFNNAEGAVVRVTQTTGNIIVFPTDVTDITGVINYKGSKPSVTYNENIFQISDSTGAKIKESNIYLPSNKPYSQIEVIVGAGNILLPLQGIEVEKINIQGNATNLDFTLPGLISSQVTINIGAGNINFIIPKNSKLKGIKIIPQNTALNLEENKVFELVNGAYQTLGFDKAEVTSTINLSAGSASISFKNQD